LVLVDGVLFFFFFFCFALVVVKVWGAGGVVNRIERGGGGKGSNKHHTQLYPLKYKFFNKKIHFPPKQAQKHTLSLI
jgi:hypothetical protein